ncbi:hypothetical protein GALMADRAFT_1172081 [Galerina marginata CBS 339.88]|uniref:Uncharacterized protein n=1 Tax=Galerina marginata (strain CBS 339.88) TaxID=685588 RepID=A0A067T9X2_GALM3|nr:hypothetical protein GALMADRAFT_1172081 [Galerina marginata CBS 339.88]
MVAKQVSGLTGKASGKRTLAEVMDQDMERKKKHRKSNSPAKPTSSKFFYTRPEIRASSVQRRHSDGIIPIAGPSRLRTQSADKENVFLLVDDDDEEMVETSEPELDGSDLSQKAQFGKDKDTDAQLEMDLNFDDFPDVVEQEDGYISPSPSRSKDAQDLSSPPGRRTWKGDPNREMAPTGMIPSDDEDDDTDFGADAISSPISVKKPQPHSRQRAYQTPMRWLGSQDADGGTILVQPTPTPKKGQGLYPDLDDVPSPTLYRGPDLRNLLGDNDPTELDYQDEEVEAKRPGVSGTISGSTSPPSPSPETPDMGEQPVVDVIDVDEFNFNVDEEETRQAQKITANAKAVMNGWREKWAMPSKKPVPVRGSGSFPPLNSPPRHFIRPLTPKKAKAFTSGSRPAHASNLKRSNANVTPAGRYSVVSYNSPRSAPSKLPATSTILNGVRVKSAGKLKRSLFVEETTTTAASTPLQVQRTEIVDLTTHDVNDEDAIVAPRRPSSATTTPRQLEQEMLSSSQMRLSHFR